MTGTTFSLPLETWKKVYIECNDSEIRDVLKVLCPDGHLEICLPEDKAAIVAGIISTWDWAAEGWE